MREIFITNSINIFKKDPFLQGLDIKKYQGQKSSTASVSTKAGPSTSSSRWSSLRGRSGSSILSSSKSVQLPRKKIGQLWKTTSMVRICMHSLQSFLSVLYSIYFEGLFLQPESDNPGDKTSEGEPFIKRDGKGRSSKVTISNIRRNSQVILLNKCWRVFGVFQPSSDNIHGCGRL